MKKRFVLLFCSMLAAGVLTGCMPADCYQTAHFTFSVSSDWYLEEAKYDKASGKSGLLRFTTNRRYIYGSTMEGCCIEEYQTDLSVREFADSLGDTEPLKELSGCQYPAWESVTYFKGEDEGNVNYANVYIQTDGRILMINVRNPHGLQPMNLQGFEQTLPALLETVTLTGHAEQSGRA